MMLKKNGISNIEVYINLKSHKDVNRYKCYYMNVNICIYSYVYMYMNMKFHETKETWNIKF